MAEQALNARVSAILLWSFLSELDVVFFVNVAGLVISTIVMHSWLRANRTMKILLPPVACGTRSFKRVWFYRFSVMWLVGCSLCISYLLLSSVSFTPLLMRPHTLSNTQLLYSLLI